MQLERIEDGFQIDADALATLLGVPTDDVQRLMREGRITSRCEKGQAEDRGRHRISFRYSDILVQLIVDETGQVLLRTQTSVAPRPGSRGSG